jgi:ferredoxin
MLLFKKPLCGFRFLYMKYYILRKESAMYIDRERCVGCGRCLPYCPREAILLEQNKAAILSGVCVECGICKSHAKCPRDAFFQEELIAPRAYRKAFSDPFGKHENTALKHMGRGTEEVKTNDVTGIVDSLEEIGFAVELGRPGVGASFSDVQTVAMAVAPLALRFEPNNPVTPLIVDQATGRMDASVLKEEVLSAIVEFTCKLSCAENVLESLKEASKKIDTVFSLCLICRVDQRDNSIPALAAINAMGLKIDGAAAKTNLGLGRPLYQKSAKERHS